MRERLMILGVVWLELSLPLIPTSAIAQSNSITDDQHPAKRPDSGKKPLRMTPGIVCSAIDGYENYKVLPKATQTSDEKLLVYFRPLGFQTEMVNGAYQAHLFAGFQIRKRGQKEVLFQKPKMYEYKPRKEEEPPRFLYMKSAISLKGLPAGDYDLTLILRDEIGKGPAVSQVVKFRIIPADDQKQEKASRSDDQPAKP